MKETETLGPIEMAQWVMVLTNKPDDLRWIPRIHRVETDSRKLYANLHMCSVVHACVFMNCPGTHNHRCK